MRIIQNENLIDQLYKEFRTIAQVLQYHTNSNRGSILLESYQNQQQVQVIRNNSTSSKELKPVLSRLPEINSIFQLNSMCSARTIQNWKRRVKNNITQSIILVHPSSGATSSLLCHSSKENFTNFNQLFTHKQLHNSYAP